MYITCDNTVFRCNMSTGLLACKPCSIIDLSVQPASAQVTVVTTQPVVVQKPVFRDYPVVVTLENGQQVSMLMYNIIIIRPIREGGVCM